MNILLLGSGGREHAMAWKISQSPRLGKLYIAPGNAGTSLSGTNVNMAADDFNSIGDFVLQHHINMVVVGPEDPLVKGIVDFFNQDVRLRDVPVIGPSKMAARLEGSKDFAKKFMLRHNIPTARYKSVTMADMDEGIRFIDSLQPPYVLKADGLAAGKGVLIIRDRNEAVSELKNMLQGKFGDAGKTVVIEEFLEGIELSFFVITDGKTYKILPEAKDYKRIGAGDNGPNTGGMGAVSPVPFAGHEFKEKIEERIIIPTIKGLQSDGIEYKGFIFFGIINCKGEPFVIEYNARMGDPETEVVLPRLKSDIIDLLDGVAMGNLSEKTVSIDERFVTTVVLASGGYPDAYEKGHEIKLLQDVRDSLVFHAGTRNPEGKIITSGGRVLAISSYGSNMKEALALSYRNANIIDFYKKYFRPDIGFDLNEF
jgi:phosphoribosylamine--glycine ligase